ncbi:MAG TPA: hypothetical protein VNJ70_05035 [Thermoanaerobaculia bacterium]|nr:hypothetical protein [Thermoanaerobaculia bacterium]
MKVFGSFLLALTLALPAAAGEVYIPFLAADAPGTDSGRSTFPTVTLYNLGGVHRRYVVRFTPAGEDGTQVRELVATELLAPQGSRQEDCCGRQSGLLVVSGAPQIAVGARLGLLFNQPGPNGLLTRLPVLTARDALRPGTTAVLHGLQGTANAGTLSSLGILNLGTATARCVVAIGIFEQFFPELGQVLVPPLSVAAFPDVFLRLRGPSGPLGFETRTRVRCDQPFYPFGVNFSGIPAPQNNLPWVEFVPPSVQLGNVP